MSNHELMIGMEHHKHELQQIEVSKPDTLNSERSLTTSETTRYRGGFGTIGWLDDHCCPQHSFDVSDRRKGKNDATIQDMLKVDK